MKSIILLVALFVTPFCLALGQDHTVSVDHVDGTLSANAIPSGELITFYIRLTNVSADTAWRGITNGFEVYSPDGAEWTTTTSDTLPTLTWGDHFDLIFQLTEFSVTGSGADTLGWAGSKMTGIGLPTLFDDTAYTITIGPIDTSHHGRMICLDSSYYPPTGIWKWASGGGAANSRTPVWGGPYCYFIVDPASPPTLVGAQPAGLTFKADGGEQPDTLTFTVLISDSSSISVDFSGALTAKAGGDFTFSPTSGTHGTEVTVSIDGRGLSEGTHTGVITLTANDAANTTFEIPITLFMDMAVSVKPIEHEVLPSDFVLSQNYPNPFNPTTRIAFDLPTKSLVTLTVYNVLGQRVITLVNEKLAAGKYVADWNGRSSGGNEVASGIYFYRLHSEQFTQTKKMVLLK